MKIFLLSTASRLALVSIQRPIKWLLKVLSLEVKRLGCEADYSPSFAAEVQNMWSYTSILNTSSWRGI